MGLSAPLPPRSGGEGEGVGGLETSSEQSRHLPPSVATNGAARWHESLSTDDREAPPTLPLPTTRKSSRGEGAERPVVPPATAPPTLEMCACPSAHAETNGDRFNGSANLNSCRSRQRRRGDSIGQRAMHAGRCQHLLQTAARVEHARLHRAGRNSDDLGNLRDRLL